MLRINGRKAETHILEVDNIVVGEGSSDAQRFVDPVALKRESTKAKGKAFESMEQCGQYFLFKYNF